MTNRFPQVQVPNQGYIISGPHNSRHFVNPGAHNVSDMKNNHMTNIARSQIQMVPTHISRRQPTDILKQQENKKNENNNHNSKNEEKESIISKPEELLQQPKENQNNGIQHKPIVEVAAPKLPSYLDNLPYAEGQWSVTNPTGKKVYSKLFLLQLGSEAVCQKKHDILRNWSNLTNFSSLPQFNSSGGMVPRSQCAGTNGFMPAYFKLGNSQCSMPIMQPGAKRNSSQGKTAKPNPIHMSSSLREEVELNQTENVWVPTTAKKATKSEVSKTKYEEEQKNESYNILEAQFILNKITPDNIRSVTERFKALPIDTIEHLEKTTNLVFEKAIEEQYFAPLCSILCSDMQSVQVSSKDGKTVSFKKLIISKCQSLFELDKAQEMDSAKKLTEINSCKDPEKKKELQLEFEENERRLRKRSVGNCRFIGELFKQKILTPNIMLYCIVNLVTKHVEEPLECLCNLLKTVGKELEKSYDLNDTFDKLKALTSRDMKSKIPSRIQLMIQDVIDLRRHKWISEKQDCLHNGGNKSCRGNEIHHSSVTTLGPPKWSFTTGKNTTFTSSNPYAVLNDDKNSSNSSQIMLMKTTTRKHKFPRPIPSINSSNAQPKEFVEEPISEIDSKIANKIKMTCTNILYEYEQMHNLDDIIYLLSEDKNSLIYTRHEEFVTSMSLIALDNSLITQTKLKMFAELLSKKIISIDAITRGIDAVLKDWNDYLMDYPQFFSYIAAIIAPLLLSQNDSFDFNNFKDCCTSIRPDNSSKLFTEVLNKILSSKETQNIKEQLGGILWIYNKWNASENVTLDVFMPTNQINKYLKKDQFGILILSIVINDKIKLTNNKLLYNVLQSWIFTNISEEIIISPLFVKDLTIAICIVCLNLNHSYDDFFDHVHLKLLSHFIEFESLPEQEIQAREVQCMYGIQTISATLKHPGGMVLKLFNKLYHHRIISKESFELFIQEYEGE